MESEYDIRQSMKKYRSALMILISVLVVVGLSTGIIIAYNSIGEHTGHLKVYQLSFGLGDCTEEEADKYAEIIGQTLGEELKMGFSTYMMEGASWDGSKIVYDGITARFVIIDTDHKLTTAMVEDAVKIAQKKTVNGFVMIEHYWSDAKLMYPL